MTGEELAASMGPGWKFTPIPQRDADRLERLRAYLDTFNDYPPEEYPGSVPVSMRDMRWLIEQAARPQA